MNKTFVYLDHHILRDSLLYERGEGREGEARKYAQTLTIRDLGDTRRRTRTLLRKPDFQRATCAWSPEECVDLLEAVIMEQVVPSVIMWLDPEGRQYVLDGGHRISVLLAWITDDWGDGPKVSDLLDDDLTISGRCAAQEVRALLQSSHRGIGSYQEHLAAAEKFRTLEDQQQNPKDHLTNAEMLMANRCRSWDSVDVGFPILWVRGDYRVAEESFLKINKTGQRLTEWETALVENRTSGFARLVMSISRSDRAPHCWPTGDLTTADAAKLPVIAVKARAIRDRLFEFPYCCPTKDQRQPLLGVPQGRPDLVPTYIAELITVVEGRRGVTSDTKALLERGKDKDSRAVVTEGFRLATDTCDALDHIYGPSLKSLAVDTLVYFYSADGRCVRALMYGFLHWIISGTEANVFDRKLLFTVYRKPLESVLTNYKQTIVKRFSRRVGSGGEVTLQVGRYLNGLVSLLVSTGGDLEGEFDQRHEDVLEGTKSHERTPENRQGQARFASRQRRVPVAAVISRCEICGGSLSSEPHKKAELVVDGEETAQQAVTMHPFCKTNREKIIAVINGVDSLVLPPYFAMDASEGTGRQLSFLSQLFSCDPTVPCLGGELASEETDEMKDMREAPASAVNDP